MSYYSTTAAAEVLGTLRRLYGKYRLAIPGMHLWYALIRDGLPESSMDQATAAIVFLAESGLVYEARQPPMAWDDTVGLDGLWAHTQAPILLRYWLPMHHPRHWLPADEAVDLVQQDSMRGLMFDLSDDG